MKIVTSAQVMYYFTSAKHEWNNTLRVHKWLFSLSRVYPTTITLSYYLFNNCFKYNFHYLWGWQWMNSLSPLVWIMNSLSSLVMIMTLFSKFTVISRNFLKKIFPWNQFSNFIIITSVNNEFIIITSVNNDFI